MESSPVTTMLSFDEQKKNARGYGIAAAICASIAAFWFIPLKPLKLIAVIAMLGLVGTGSKFIFHGSTAFSMTLQGAKRKWFQIFISLIIPILFSIYFLKDAQSVTLEGINVFLFQDWIAQLFSIGLIGYFSWIVAKYLDRYHPFRGFIIASTIFFVLCLIVQHGIRIGSDDDAYGYRHKEAVEGGLYLFWYIRCVLISYTAMFLGLCWNRWINYASLEEQKKYKKILDVIYVSIRIVSDYGAILEKESEKALISMPESRLPHSKEKIKNAIECIEIFIEKALSDERLKENFFLHPAAALFGKNGAEYTFSEKYRESLKTGLASLDTLVSDEEVEKGK